MSISQPAGEVNLFPIFVNSHLKYMLHQVMLYHQVPLHINLLILWFAQQKPIQRVKQFLPTKSSLQAMFQDMFPQSEQLQRLKQFCKHNILMVILPIKLLIVVIMTKKDKKRRNYMKVLATQRRKNYHHAYWLA